MCRIWFIEARALLLRHSKSPFTMFSQQDLFQYPINPDYQTSVTYFSMEFAIDQSLKIYSGGLGFLAGSHMRSAYELGQNLIGVGILWKYGYYDQARNGHAFMKSDFVEKHYSFLEDTGIVFSIAVNNSPVFVKAYLLRPDTFRSAPIFLLSTDIEQNDYLARTITHRLYDPNENTRVAQSIVLGIGGAKLMDEIDRKTDIYHMNEGHALPLTFYLYDKWKDAEEVKKHVVFTTHTPEMAGNEEHDISLLSQMSFFFTQKSDAVRKLLGIEGDRLNYTLTALKLAKLANGVSQLHGKVANDMWGSNPGICKIISITNAQQRLYWQDKDFAAALHKGDNAGISLRKKQLKSELFKIVADQTGKLFREDVFTLVWARRFAAYKRADLLMRDWDAFVKLLGDKERPIQIIWAGKPYPEDEGAKAIFNHLISATRKFANCAVLTGYELGLSAALKKGSDGWLNNPVLYREASGTSGMTAAMNGSVNISIADGWMPEFAEDGKNCFLIQAADDHLSPEQRDDQENTSMMQVLEEKVLPTYYQDSDAWGAVLGQAERDVLQGFNSDRMADEYYKKMYNYSE